jgi:XTP/dITP diphosphohydrolase
VRIYTRSKNAGKGASWSALAGRASSWRVPRLRDVVEGETDYAENAALKARALHAQLLSAGIEAAVLADDSGLEIDALDGRPGRAHRVLRRRRRCRGRSGAGSCCEELERSGSDRSARAVRLRAALHRLDGPRVRDDGDRRWRRSPNDERGELGFSFDPVFYYPPLRRTFAELSDEEKNRVSYSEPGSPR